VAQAQTVIFQYSQGSQWPVTFQHPRTHRVPGLRKYN